MLLSRTDFMDILIEKTRFDFRSKLIFKIMNVLIPYRIDKNRFIEKKKSLLNMIT